MNPIVERIKYVNPTAEKIKFNFTFIALDDILFFWWIFFFLVNISTIVLNIFCSWYGNDVYTVDKEELPKNLFVPKTKPAENSAILKNQNLLSQYSRLKFQIFIFISFFIFCFFVLMPIKNGNWR